MTNHITLKETAKLIREELKKKFPNIKFSVRGKSYSGGSSIDVEWFNGVCEDRVKEAVKKFEGADFDGMIDLKSYKEGELNGEKVFFGADFIFCKRELTDEMKEKLNKELSEKHKIPFNPDVSHSFDLNNEYLNMAQLIHREFYNKDLEVLK